MDDMVDISFYLQDYLTYLKSHDGTDHMQIETIVAVAFFKKNVKVP
jgi:hypothetical protein